MIKKLLAAIAGALVALAAAAADIESVRSQLKGPLWSRIVGVQSKTEGENAEVFPLASRTVAYGATRDSVLALEAVMADGEVITLGSRAIKSSSGYDLLRRYLNGVQNDSKLGSISFTDDQSRDAITNMRMGLATKIFISVGDTHRRFRNWDQSYYVGDKFQATPSLTVNLGLRYQPVSVPTEADGLTTFPYHCDCNNFAPMGGAAWRMPRANPGRS